jgi:hypothetical protein
MSQEAEDMLSLGSQIVHICDCVQTQESRAGIKMAIFIDTSLLLAKEFKIRIHTDRKSHQPKKSPRSQFVRLSTQLSSMCTRRNIVLTHCNCTPILIIKCPAQEFVEQQAIKYNRNPPLIYKYCVNYMVTNDRRRWCCRGKVEGFCYAERRRVKTQKLEDEPVKNSAEFGALEPLGIDFDWEDCLRGLKTQVMLVLRGAATSRTSSVIDYGGSDK